MLNDLHVPVPPAIVLRIARIAAFATRTLLGALLIAMMLLNVANAVCRYLFSVVLIGADELLVFAMIWMVMTNTPLGHLLDRRELIVERNFIGGCFLVGCSCELTRQFTDILRKLRSEVLDKVMSLRPGIALCAGLFFLPLTETLSTQCRTKFKPFYLKLI